ncbi:DMT family transporter [Entomobacter blattae]|uniref:EamA-like transporter family protein n=1 Tax=Entomobacter blattae TaxID=2762277 RepID=A0A7H1NPW4_9PROT|nr:DMT family transporter [Entomobacter blattae]QNT77824.1 EamA-like transporter family protein [Entomobacter blattae]
MTIIKQTNGNISTLSNENLGLLLGTIAVIAFSLTLPITRYLTYFLNTWEIGLGRTFLAAIGAVIILFIKPQPLPNKKQWGQLAITASGIAFGFPLLTALGMKTVPASHGGIVLGSLPLATALIGCLLSKERPSIAFWSVAFIGFGIVCIFSIYSNGGLSDISFYTGDFALIGAVIMAGLGYAQGGILARSLGGWQVICWTLIVSLPLLIPITIIAVNWNDFAKMPLQPWLAFCFLALVNSLIGFFFWYKSLAIGGIARVSQIQLLQPFFTWLFAVVFLGEMFSMVTLFFTVLTMLIVMLSKKTPITK